MRTERRLRAPALALTILLGCTAATAAQTGELGADLDGLLQYARRQSPELTAMHAEAEAASQRVQPAGALPDPVLRIELENFNNYGSDASPNLLPSKVGATKYTLMQPIPAWGKRDLRSAMASADTSQAAARTVATWNELATRIKAAYAQYHLAAGNERLTQDVVDLVSRLESLAQARYAGGLVAQQDAIRAQLERTQLQSELIALESAKRQARARINGLLARDIAAPLAEPRELRALPPLATLQAEALAQRARAANPLLTAEDARLRAAEASRELARRNRYPDFVLGLSSTQVGTRTTGWGLMFEVAIPLQQASRDAQERETESMVGAQRARTEAVASQLLGELGEHLAALDAARRSEALYGSQLLPQSELGFRSALAAYENGKVDFATLLDAQRQILRARQDRLKAQAEAQMRLAEIERILGEDL